jgi:hypothetical protein
MLISLALAAVVAGGPHQAPPSCATRLFDDVRLHTGGARWDAAKELIADGSVNGSGLSGPARIATDLVTGATSVDDQIALAPERIVSSPSATWKQDLTRGVHRLDAPDARAAAISSAYLARNGYFRPANDPATFTCLPNAVEDGRPLRQVRVTPRGGRAVTLWVDPAAHVIVRTQQQAPSDVMTTSYGAYRQSDGLLLPYEIVDTNSRPEDTVVHSIRSYRIRTAVAATDFARPPDSRNQHFRNGATSTQIPADVTGGSPIVEAYVNGHGPLPFILDTGGHAILTADAAKQLGLVAQGGGVSGGAAEGTIAQQYAHVDSLRIGDAEITGFPMFVIPYDQNFSNRGPGKTPLAGILGLEVFERFVVTVDYANGTLRLQSPEGFAPPVDAMSVPIVFQDDMPLTYGRADGATGLFGVDTGNSGGIFLFGDFLRRNGFFARYSLGAAGQSMGTGGAVHSSTYRLDALDLGGLEMRNFVTNFVVQQHGSFGSRTEAGNIGHDVLAQFTLTTDYTRGRMYLRRNPNAPLPSYTRTGLVLRGFDAARHLIVGSIVPNSPASEAGVLPGDIVVAVDGKPTETLSIADLFAFTRLPLGTAVHFSVSTGSAAPRDVTLTLRELLCNPNAPSCSPSVQVAPPTH